MAKTLFLKRDDQRGGFTLVELLVVIAIIGVLIALLLPAVQVARESARRTQCSNNMRQVAIAMHTHHDTYRALPPGALSGSEVTEAHRFYNRAPGPKHNWAIFLLPYLEQQPLYEAYRWDLDWREAGNQQVRETFLPVMLCPSSPTGKRTATGKIGSYTWTAACGDYGVANGISFTLGGTGLVDQRSVDNYEGMMRTNYADSFSRATDGLSYTMWYCEDAGRPLRFFTGGKAATGAAITGGAWADRDNAYIMHGYTGTGLVTPGPCAINCTNNNEIYSFHRAGANCMMGDASIQFLAANTSIRIVARLLTVQGGEPSGWE